MIMGLHPPKSRYVKPYQYRVQPGDDVGVITGYFGMPQRRWPELVGANPDKMLGSPPAGYIHRCFQELEVGERLNVPGHWREPVERRLGLGAVGGSSLVIPSGGMSSKVTDFLKMFQDAVKNAMSGGVLPPMISPMPDINQLSAVVFSWWPHLGDAVPLPGLPKTPPSSVATIMQLITDNVFTVKNWSLLFNSANEFLKATGIGQAGQAEGPAVQTIPWPDIPWDKIPWPKIDPDTWAKLTRIFSQQAEVPWTTPPVMTKPGQVNTPDFLTTNWAAQPYAGLVEGTTWSDFLVEVMKDTRFQSCMSAKPEVLGKLRGCPQCWTTPTQFVDLLCSDKPNPCDCSSAPPAESNGGSNTGWYVAGAVGIIALIAIGVSK